MIDYSKITQALNINPVTLEDEDFPSVSNSDNQEKQIEILQKMVDQQGKMIEMQAELICRYREDVKESSKQSFYAMVIAVASLLCAIIQIIPSILEGLKWITELFQSLA